MSDRASRRRLPPDPDRSQALNHSHLNFNSFAFGRPFCESIRLMCLGRDFTRPANACAGVRLYPQDEPGGEALRDGIDRRGLFSKSRADWVDRARADRPPGARCRPDLQLCNTGSIDGGQWGSKSSFIWRRAGISEYPSTDRKACRGGFAGGHSGSLLVRRVFTCGNNRVGMQGQRTW